MSSGSTNNRLRVSNDLQQLAPLFRAAVEKAIAECNQAGLDAIVYEAYRSPELQQLYFARGRTIVPPIKTVTNASTNLKSWHGYGLAVDVISRSKGWSPRAGWWDEIAAIFERNNCNWGGRWRTKDLPHFQWHLCKASPSEEARQMIKTEGVQAVWRAVNAIDENAQAEIRVIAQTLTQALESGTVSADTLRLRRDPSTTNPPIRLLARGTKIFILEAQDGWLKVRVGGDDGWVSDKFVTRLAAAGNVEG